MDPVYLDHAATTPLREEVRAAMQPCQAEAFGNASSLHRWGRAAHAALEGARADVAEALGARPSEIFFVRGGTESDNLAVIGSIRAKAESKRPLLVVSAIEHSAVLDAAAHVAALGTADVQALAVSPDGAIDLDALSGMIEGRDATVSVMWVNNETGAVLPVGDIARLARAHGATLHTDAAQAVGKVPVDVRDVPVDLLTATGHKINGPKGTGILFVREGTPLRPLLFGGGQERGLRPGTEDVAGAVGFATALRLAVREREATAERLSALRDTFEAAVRTRIPGLRINCAGATRSPHVSSVGIPDADGGGLLMALDLEGIAVSGGSACHSGAAKGSHVIAALYGDDDAMATLRFSFGLGTSQDDVLRAAHATGTVVERMRGAR
jgi:cysteine desulfurase